MGQSHTPAHSCRHHLFPGHQSRKKISWTGNNPPVDQRLRESRKYFFFCPPGKICDNKVFIGEPGDGKGFQFPAEHSGDSVPCRAITLGPLHLQPVLKILGMKAPLVGDFKPGDRPVLQHSCNGFFRNFEDSSNIWDCKGRFFYGHDGFLW